MIDDVDPGKFFSFKQGDSTYYAVSHEELGYVVFTLPSSFHKHFKSNGYSSKIMIELFEQEVEHFYFVSFADEDYETCIIEYVGDISKDIVLEFYNEGKLDKNYRYSISDGNSKH